MQNNSLVSLFTKTIHKDFQLYRKDRYWILKDKYNKESLNFRSIDKDSFAFSLDKDNSQGGKDNSQGSPFGFFSDNPPANINKICDAIIVMEYKQKELIVAIEKKSTNPKEYTKQLKNAKYFCDWLINLFKEYNHYEKSQSPTFCKLLCWESRKIPSKGTTSHDDKDYECCKSDDNFFDFSCKVQNKSVISLLELIQVIKKNEKKRIRQKHSREPTT